MVERIFKSVVGMIALITCVWCISSCSIATYTVSEMPCHQQPKDSGDHPGHAGCGDLLLAGQPDGDFHAPQLVTLTPFFDQLGVSVVQDGFQVRHRPAPPPGPFIKPPTILRV